MRGESLSFPRQATSPATNVHNWPNSGEQHENVRMGR
jgi:hypothetical protein